MLRFMGEAPLGPLFVCEVEAYLSIAGTTADRLGLGAVGEASFVRQLSRGSCAAAGHRRPGPTLDGPAFQCRAAPGDRGGDAVPGWVGSGHGRRSAAPRFISGRTRSRVRGRCAKVPEHR